MKKLLACALIFVMCLGSLAACGKEPEKTDVTPTTAPTTAPTQAPVEDTVSDLVNAKNYLFTMYKDQTEATPVDYTVVGVVNIGGTLFPIEWTVDNASVKIVPGDDKMVTIDVDDKNPEEVTYVLTATLKDDKGNTESCSFTHRVPAAIILDEGMTYADIVDAAYTLEDGLAMEGTFRLYGTITKVDTPWSPDYKNITVTIAVAGKEDKPIMCYRLKGDGAENLKVGDAITVEGTFKNYKGTIEYDAGCVLVGYGEHKDYTALLDAAYTLEDGLAMQEPCTMSGVITKIDTPWSPDYKNITVTMVVNGVEDKPIMCYRLQGEGAEGLAIGDYITVTGTIKNYKGTIEFDAKCNLDNVVKAAGSVTEEPVEETDLVINFADLSDGGYGYSATINGDAVDVTIASQYQEIQYILPDVVDLAAYTTLIVDVTSNAQLDIKLVDPNAEINEYSQKAPFLDNYTAEGQAITEAIVIDLTAYADKDLSQINFMAMGNDTAFTIKSITFTKEPVEAGPVITAADLFDAAKVIDVATNMADDATFAAVLQGTVAEINTAYSEQYGNISITINVAGTDKTFYCFRLKGEGVATLAVGDAVTIVGTISKYNGAPQFGAGCLLIPAEAFESVQTAVAGYALAVDEVLENKTITGVVTEVNTAYSEQYGNVTVTIVAAGQDAYKIECFRMKGDVASTVAVGDTITVTGKLKNYNGKIEFDAGCVGVLAAAEAPVAADLVINFATLTAGGYGYNATVNGDVVDVTIASQYQEIQYVLPEAVDLAAYTTLIVDVTSNAQLDIKLVDPNAELNQYSQKAPFHDGYTAEGQAITEPIYIDLAAFADKDLSQINFMAMGNDTVFTIKSITFVKEATDVPAEPTEGPEEPVTPTVDYSAMTPAELLDAAYALADGEAFTAACTLTGVISEINSEWSDKYGNITVTIVVDGKEDKKIECFRLVGDGAATLAVGDTITVTGIMKNYNGKIEFDAKCNLDAVVKAEGGEATTTVTGIDLSAGLEAGVDYNGISVLDNMSVKESVVEIDGVTYNFYVAGSNNPSPKNGEIPTEGAAVVATPTANGTLTVVFKLNNGKSYHVVCSDGTIIETASNDSGESQYLTKSYAVEAGKTYYVYGNGTKLPFYFIGLN